MKSSRLLPYIMGAVIIGVSTPFLIHTKPALAECDNFGGCTHIERRVHCKGLRGCTVQYRLCRMSLARDGRPATPWKCGDWKNSL